MKTDQPKTIRLQDYTPPSHLIDAIALDFELDPTRTIVRARLDIRANPDAAAGDGRLHLDGEALELLSIHLDGEPLDPDAYTLGEDGLTLKAPPPAFRLEIETACRPADNTKLEGLYLSSQTYCTQCEAEGFRRITYFPDRPDVMATYRVRIAADKAQCPVLLSNGNIVESGELDDGRHFAVWDDPFPKPSYLFALVAGRLGCFEDSFTTASGRTVALKIYVEPGNEPRCAYAMDSLKRAMRWDEEVYGLEYDLDVFNIVAVGDFNMGAMENKSLNLFNAKYILADSETATDADYESIESIVAHEYFHNWTGNRVTCRDWFQLSLKEGLTVFRDQQFSGDQRSKQVQRIRDVRQLRARQFPEDAGPLAHPVRPHSYMEINNFYTATVYEKGAEVIRMLHTLLGADGFRKGMDLYFQRHDGCAVTCDDFVAAMEDATGTDLKQFRLWYSQAGTPEIDIETRYDETTLGFELTLRQTMSDTPGQTDKQPMHIPIKIGLMDGAGNAIPLQEAGSAEERGSLVVHLTEAEQTFRFSNMLVEPVLSVNRGFSAPIKRRSNPSPQEVAFLMACDPDPFARWDAGQQFAIKLLMDMVDAGQVDPAAAAPFLDAMARVLDDTDLDKAFKAEIMSLPSEEYLSEQLTVIDPDAVHTAREALRLTLARQLSDPLLATYNANKTNEAFSPDARFAGQRALKNTALSYLGALQAPDSMALVEAQYRTADNMTDCMAALSVLSRSDHPLRNEALDDFYGRWRDNPLVTDKWLALQATAPLPTTLDTVQGLLHHPAFSIKNPNKVRALIGAFSAANPTCFHRADGGGYAFLADRILELDKLNPQVAARLVGPLGRWRRFDSARQDLMKKQLTRIADADSLSRDVYELVAKSLD